MKWLEAGGVQVVPIIVNGSIDQTDYFREVDIIVILMNMNMMIITLIKILILSKSPFLILIEYQDCSVQGWWFSWTVAGTGSSSSITADPQIQPDTSLSFLDKDIKTLNLLLIPKSIILL